MDLLGNPVSSGIRCQIFLDGTFVGVPIGLPVAGAEILLQSIQLVQRDGLDLVQAMARSRAPVALVKRADRYVAFGNGYVVSVIERLHLPAALTDAREPRLQWYGQCDWLGTLTKAPLYGPWPEDEGEAI